MVYREASEEQLPTEKERRERMYPSRIQFESEDERHAWDMFLAAAISSAPHGAACAWDHDMSRWAETADRAIEFRRMRKGAF